MYTLHVVVAWIVVVGNALAGGWALLAHRRRHLAGGPLWWFTGVVQVAVSLQVLVGVLLMQNTDREPGDRHVLYGAVAAITVGILFSYRSQLRDRVLLLYGFGGLFIAGLAVRAMVLTPS